MHQDLCRAVFTLTLVVALAGLPLAARDNGPAVAYYPQTENVEGDQPLYYSYELEITSPSNVPAGAEVTITPVLFVIRAPAGVSPAVALGHVSMNPSTLQFTGPNQKRYTTVISDFPAGTVAGEYAFGIRTPNWPLPATDTFGFINAKVFPPRLRDVPSITLSTPVDGTVYTWTAGGAPVEIPIQFSATAPEGSPITSVDADLNGSGIALTDVAGLGTATVDAGGRFYTTTPGLYTITARATNDVGTSSDSAEITIHVVAPPPTVSIAQPSAGTHYTTAIGQPLSVPFAFSASSVFGGISQLTATLNDQPVSFTPMGLGSLNASGLANLSVTAGGVYVLSVSATNPYGTAATTSHFTVTTVEPTPPPPTITIASPVDGTLITRTTGTPATQVPFSFTTSIESGWSIVSIGASLNGQTIPITATGLGTTAATGTGTIAVSAPGIYTLVATGASSGSSAATSISFRVEEIAPPPVCHIEWLPPISLGKVQQGCSTIPIKFLLHCCAPRPDRPCVAEKDRCGWGWDWGWGQERDDRCERHGHRSLCDDRDRFGKAADSRECSKGKRRAGDHCERHGHRSRCNSDFDDRVCVRGAVPRWSSSGSCERHGSRSHCAEHNARYGSNPRSARADCHECNPDYCGKPGHQHQWCAQRDTSVVIAIYEIFADGSSSEPALHTFSPTSPNSPHYTITGGYQYHLNFRTERGKHRYHIDVYRQLPGAPAQLVGTKEFLTK